MTHWYRVSIVMGQVPTADRSVLSSLANSDLVFEGSSHLRTMTTGEVEAWVEQLTAREIRVRLDAGIAMYAAES